MRRREDPTRCQASEDADDRADRSGKAQLPEGTPTSELDAVRRQNAQLMQIHQNFVNDFTDLLRACERNIPSNPTVKHLLNKHADLL